MEIKSWKSDQKEKQRKKRETLRNINARKKMNICNDRRETTEEKEMKRRQQKRIKQKNWKGEKKEVKLSGKKMKRRQERKRDKSVEKRTWKKQQKQFSCR